jgi:inorganic triphosphatase YgiF
MTELELKLQVPPGARDAVRAALAGDRFGTIQLQACYVDTADGRLAAHRFALRLRQEGPQWVQTLKGAGDSAVRRLEHNAVLTMAEGEEPAIDLARHAGTPAGDALTALLGQPLPPLVELYRTDIQRLRGEQSVAHGRIELAFDEGRIVAGAREWPVCELEIELVDGTPAAVVEQARAWVLAHGLWLDVVSKAERGERLLRGQTFGPVTDAGHGSPRELLERVLANASEVAAGSPDPGHAQQLRLGLQRLCAGLPAPPAALASWPATADAVRQPAVQVALIELLGQALGPV